jgi:16S rRNA G1207 methylase RsmC
LLRELGVSVGDQFVDLGSGRGQLVLWMARHSPHLVKSTGVECVFPLDTSRS